jgi:hypothetical protein
MPKNQVRANILALDTTTRLLKMVRELTTNMDRGSNEMTLALQIGVGCAGLCMQDKIFHVAQLDDDRGKYTIPQSEFSKCDPNMRWIICFPILPKEATVMVLSIDGLMERRSLAQLEMIAKMLPGYASAIHLMAGAKSWSAE